MTTEQHISARERANEVRLLRSQLKAAIMRGERTISEALNDPCCQSMAIFDLLCAQWDWGRARTVRVLSRLMIGERRRVEELTDRQRLLIVNAVREHAPRRHGAVTA